MQILAWISHEDGLFVACWSASDNLDRPPATWAFTSKEAARAWIYFEAELLGARVKWLDQPHAGD